MKQTLYEMLEVKPESTQTEIEAAYAAVRVRLQPGIDRADTDAINLSRLLKVIAAGLWINLKMLNKGEDIRVEFAEAARQKKAEKEKPQVINIDVLPPLLSSPGPARKTARR
jgi:hypothetical protein